jgi:hypothetical protein
MEWVLNTPKLKRFEKTITQTITVSRTEPVVDEDGNPSTREVHEERRVESEGVLELPASRVRLAQAINDEKNRLFHIRLLYGRTGELGEFEGAMRDDGIVIGGPNYEALDTNQDGTISEDELLNMSAKILGWDGTLKRDLPEEGLA